MLLASTSSVLAFDPKYLMACPVAVVVSGRPEITLRTPLRRDRTERSVSRVVGATQKPALVEYPYVGGLDGRSSRGGRGSDVRPPPPGGFVHARWNRAARRGRHGQFG